MDSNSGGPFGAVVVKDGRIIAEGNNRVTSTNDPTAHAEIVAIREACRVLGTFQLSGCSVYTSCEPCPMCLGAIYWSRPDNVFFAGTRVDAAKAGFDDDFIYEELEKTHSERSITIRNFMRDEAVAVFDRWIAKADKVAY
jgi:tRNA(Arg) A34 adenosine deaminase TadA